jgi:hypothetical protein
MSNEPDAPRMSAKDKRVGLAMLAGTAAIVGLAIVVNIPSGPSTPPTGTGNVVRKVLPALPAARGVQELLPCDSPILKRAFEAAMRSMAASINPTVAEDAIADAADTVFTQLTGADQLGFARYQLGMISLENMRLCSGDGKNGRSWIIGEYRHGDRIEGAFFNTNSGFIIQKFPITQ